MPADADILVSCTDAACSLRSREPLLDLQTLILIYPDDTIPGYAATQADKLVVACPACARAGREGILVYLADHLRKSPPDMKTWVPVVFDATTSLWKRASELWTVTGQTADYRPEKVAPAVAMRLDVRPYGGHVLRFGNSDLTGQYDQSPADAKLARGHIRQLKHDLLFLAYYGTRERVVAKDLGGVPIFEATLVGALLALKFDLSFFYGVPTTTDLSQTTVSDDELRGTTLESFSKPIYFDPNLPDNPIKAIAQSLIYPLAERLRLPARARKKYDAGIQSFRESRVAGLSAAKVKQRRTVALRSLVAGMALLKKEAPTFDLSGVDAVPGVRKSRSVGDVLAHPEFASCRRSPWDHFADDLLLLAGVDPRIAALDAILADLAGDEALRQKFQGPVDRYKLHAEALLGAPEAQLETLRQIIGGLPETFAPYRAAMHRYAIVDHATAFYIKAMLAEIRIGSASGKLTAQPGRKLVYHAPFLGIQGEPETLDAYADLVIEACKENGKFVVPPMILLERQKNESGYRATDAVGNLAVTADELKAKGKVRVPMIGIDWSNWGRKGAGVSNYAFSELFTNSVGRRQSEYPGYFGPIVHSRGVGGGQVTAPTIVAGVSPKSRREIGGHEWVCGIPVPNDETMPTPGNWVGSKTSIERSRDLLRSKFQTASEEHRDCTYDKAGGKRYDCAACLARFDLARPDIAWNTDTAGSYRCTADASRWPALFGEPLASDDDVARTEFPCSWLRAVQRYAGTGPDSQARVFATVHEVVAIGKKNAADDATDEDGEAADEADGEEEAPKGKKGKTGKKPEKRGAGVVIQDAFDRVRKQL